MNAKEFLRRVWIQEPKLYHEKEFCETMEEYAEYKIKELKGKQNE